MLQSSWNASIISLDLEGVFADNESGVACHKYEIWTAGHTVEVPTQTPGCAAVSNVTNLTVPGSQLLFFRFYGVNGAGAETRCCNVSVWLDVTPPAVYGEPAFTATPHVLWQNDACWDRVAGRFDLVWDGVFGDYETGVVDYDVAVGTPVDPGKHFPRAYVGAALSVSLDLSFSPGDDVVFTVWARNAYRAESVAQTQASRVDPDAPRAAAPVAVRDVQRLPGGADLPDVDYQSDAAAVFVDWSGWDSEFGWILRYDVKLYERCEPVRFYHGSRVRTHGWRSCTSASLQDRALGGAKAHFQPHPHTHTDPPTSWTAQGGKTVQMEQEQGRRSHTYSHSPPLPPCQHPLPLRLPLQAPALPLLFVALYRS